MPAEIRAALRSHPDFGEIRTWSAEPEARVAFDGLRGEPSNLDVLLTAEDSAGPFAVAIEAKADESFGQRIVGALRAAETRRASNPRSRGVDRIAALVKSLFGTPLDDIESLGGLRYQLFTASAAALAAARALGSPRAVLLVHEFVTSRTTDERHRANQTDLNAFVGRLSGGAVESVGSGEVKGPFGVPGEEGVGLYLGKARRVVGRK